MPPLWGIAITEPSLREVKGRAGPLRQKLRLAVLVGGPGAGEMRRRSTFRFGVEKPGTRACFYRAETPLMAQCEDQRRHRTVLVAEWYFFRAGSEAIQESEAIHTNGSQATRKYTGDSRYSQDSDHTLFTTSPDGVSATVPTALRTRQWRSSSMQSRVRRLCVPTLLGRSLGSQRDVHATKNQCETKKPQEVVVENDKVRGVRSQKGGPALRSMATRVFSSLLHPQRVHG